ncbi:MAG TPA: aspartate kinase, partial [Tenuifilum sp.]|nr:aspartate kinase [Tenuifilum sp.]HRS44284.1 aspartate kinase [Tenuifilum sp.]
MRVFKFGGASVKSAGAIRNLANIVKRFSTENLVIVVSAMAKTTNALEEVLMYWMNADLT